MQSIPWWKINIDNQNLYNLNKNFKLKNISEGKVTKQLEVKIQKLLKVKYAIATTSGTSAILLVLIYLKKKFKDKNEIIISNRAWISPAHSAFLLDLKLVLVDVKREYPIADEECIKQKINKKTLAIICVQLNGKSVDIEYLKKSKNYKKFKPFILEDAAQSFYSKSNNKFIGTIGDAGILSFSMGKLISCGQGGAIITNNKILNNKLRLIKNNGIVNRYTDKWNTFGLNFKFTDIQASLLIDQIVNIKKTSNKLKSLFLFYAKQLSNINSVKLIHDKNDLGKGWLPLYIECKSNRKEELIETLSKKKIQTRKIYPSLNSTKYLKINQKKFLNSNKFYKESFYLPSGPHQNKKNLIKIFKILKSNEKK